MARCLSDGKPFGWSDECTNDDTTTNCFRTPEGYIQQLSMYEARVTRQINDFFGEKAIYSPPQPGNVSVHGSFVCIPSTYFDVVVLLKGQEYLQSKLIKAYVPAGYVLLYYLDAQDKTVGKPCQDPCTRYVKVAIYKDDPGESNTDRKREPVPCDGQPDCLYCNPSPNSDERRTCVTASQVEAFCKSAIEPRRGWAIRFDKEKNVCVCAPGRKGPYCQYADAGSALSQSAQTSKKSAPLPLYAIILILAAAMCAPIILAMFVSKASSLYSSTESRSHKSDRRSGGSG